MTNVLSLGDIKAACVKKTPYPYFLVDNAIRDEQVVPIIRDFPNVKHGGSYNLDDVAIGPKFSELLDSIDTPEFRQAMTDKFGVDVMNSPLMITLRGHSRQKDGHIHTDSKTKLLTILIYLNEEWNAETGRLRVLRSATDINDFEEEVFPGPGVMFGFKVTEHGWHGYVPFDGKRQSIQVNFLTSEAANSKHRFFHGLSAKLKKLRR